MADGRGINLDLEAKSADSEKEQQQQFIETLQTLPDYKEYQERFEQLFGAYERSHIPFLSQDGNELSAVFARIIPFLKNTNAEDAYVILKFLYLHLSAETQTEHEASETKAEDKIEKEKYKRKAAINLLDCCSSSQETLLDNSFIYIDLKKATTEKLIEKLREKNIFVGNQGDVFMAGSCKRKSDVSYFSTYGYSNTPVEKTQSATGEQLVDLTQGINYEIVFRYFEAYQAISKGIDHLKTVMVDILFKHLPNQFQDILKKLSLLYILENKENITKFLENPEKMKVYAEIQQHLHESIKTQMLAVLREYANNNLKENNEHKHVGKGIWVFPIRKTWNTRGEAYDQLVEAINQSSSSWAQFNGLCQDRIFQKNAGYTNQSRGFVAKILNTDGNLGTLWNRIRALKDIIKKQNTFFEKFKDDQLLREVLGNDIYFSLLTHKELKRILRHCNQALFCELIEKRLQSDWQQHIKIPNIHPRLNEILAAGKTAKEIEQVNFQRYQLGIGSIVPAGYQSPDLSKNTQILSPEELFQLEESDISNAEFDLMKKNANVLVNKLLDEESQEIKADNLHVKFFYVPVAIMNQDSEKWRDLFFMSSEEKQNQNSDGTTHLRLYKKNNALVYYIENKGYNFEDKKLNDEVVKLFNRPDLNRNGVLNNNHQLTQDERNVCKSLLAETSKRGHTNKKLKELVGSINPGQPIIVSGIHNFDGVHYVPFFIYKNSNNKIKVICVDPSPAWSEKNTCPKKTAFKKHGDFFRKIFTDFDVKINDPMVSQQIRQRDCGFNALTVLEDAYQKGAVEIRNDEMVIHRKKLTVNFDNRGLDIQGNGFYYSPKAIQMGKENREKWANRLRNRDHKIFIGQAQELLTLDTHYSILEYEEKYSYQENVSAQYKKDTEGDLNSSVAAYIHDDIENAKQQLSKSLDLPNIDSIVEKVKCSKTLTQEITQKGFSVEFFVSNIIEINLHDHYSDAIIDGFRKVSGNYRPKNHDNIKQDMQNILSSYHANSKVTSCLDKISEHKKKQALSKITLIAEDKIIELIGDSIKKYLNKHLPKKIKNLGLNEVCSIFKDEKQLNSFIEQNKLLDKPLEEFHSSYIRKHFIKYIEFLLQQHCIQDDQRHRFFDLCEHEFKRFAENENQEMKDMKLNPNPSLPKLFNHFLGECKYIMGQIDFDSFTVRMRILLCQIFNIESDQMPHLDGKTAFELDKEIMKRITHLTVHPDELKVGITYPMLRPIYVKGEETIPKLNGKKLTPKLLTQFAANWMENYKNYSKVFEEFPSGGLNRLLQALNHLPLDAAENDQLIFQWCHKYLQPILGLEQQDEISQQFISALKTSAFFNPFVAEKAPGNLGMYPLSRTAEAQQPEMSHQQAEVKEHGPSTN